jgi:predicted RNase H-related nuclease YkuK (DUF458 family)
MNINNRFKKFGGEHIPDITTYLNDYIKRDPSVTISVGCDSIQKRRRTLFAVTIMMYSIDFRNGAHVVFFRENVNKIRNHYERLAREAEVALEVAEFLHGELLGSFERIDLGDIERKRYKYHIAKCNGEFKDVSNEEALIRNLPLTEAEKQLEYKLVDLHLDFNPFEGIVDKRGVAKNKSNLNYKTSVPWLRSMGYRVYAKPLAHAATSAADLLLQD